MSGAWKNRTWNMANATASYFIKMGRYGKNKTAALPTGFMVFGAMGKTIFMLLGIMVLYFIITGRNGRNLFKLPINDL